MDRIKEILKTLDRVYLFSFTKNELDKFCDLNIGLLVWVSDRSISRIELETYFYLTTGHNGLYHLRCLGGEYAIFNVNLR